MNTSLGLNPVSTELEINMLELGFPLFQDVYSNSIRAINAKGEMLFDCFIYTGNPPQVVYRTSGERWTVST